MNKQFIFIFSILTTLSLPLSGNAAIYKHVDEHGKITYSNVKIKGGKKVYIEPADTSFGTNSPKERAETGSKEAAPTNFPKVDPKVQKNRDNTRKQILRSELKSQQKALAAAKEAYDEGAKNPETFKKANGGFGRNAAKYQEKMKKLQENVDQVQRNVDELNKELSNMN